MEFHVPPAESANVSAAVSSFSELLHAGRFAVTAEIAPPASGDPQALLERALPLRGLADAVNVTDGAQARASMSALAAAAILAQHDIEPILQMSCRDRNRIALQSDLLGASALGIRNLLMLRGDDPTAGDQAGCKAGVRPGHPGAGRDRRDDARPRRVAVRPCAAGTACVLHWRHRFSARSAARAGSRTG